MLPSVYLTFHTKGKKRMPVLLRQHCTILLLKIHVKCTVSTSTLVSLLWVVAVLFQKHFSLLILKENNSVWSLWVITGWRWPSGDYFVLEVTPGAAAPDFSLGSSTSCIGSFKGKVSLVSSWCWQILWTPFYSFGCGFLGFVFELVEFIQSSIPFV